MNPQSASRTAVGAALIRALHARADPQPILGDPWAERLVPPQMLAGIYQMIRARAPHLPESPDPATARAVLDAALRANPAFANVIVRSRYAEDALHRAVARGVRQYVLIGAGFDSYALRAPPESAGVTVIEIDHPATQSLKRQCIAQSGTAVPGSTHFLAADLSTEDLPSVLRKSPLHASEPAFFSWLGVTMYLSREANLTTLRAIASTSAPGSELVFSYVDQVVFDAPDANPEAFRALQKEVASIGEPFVSGFHPATLKDELAPLGYALLEEAGDVDLVRTYDPQNRNGLTPRVHSRIAHARVTGAGAQ